MSRELYAVTYGRELQHIAPEIADEYRAGKTLLRLVDQFEIVGRFNLTDNRVKSAGSIIYFALVGNKHPRLGELYEGLLNPDEVGALGREHQFNGRSANGFKMQEAGIGIFSMSPEDRAAVSSKTGTAMKEEGRGIFGLTTDERRTHGEQAAINRGETIYQDDEVILTYLILEEPRLHYSNGRRKLSEMAELINNKMYDGNSVRNENSLRSLWRRKKSFIARLPPEEKARVRAQYLDDLL